MASLVSRKYAVELPVAEYRGGCPASRSLLGLAKREFIHIAEVEHVRDVEIRVGAVPVKDTRGIPSELRPITIAGHVDGMGVSVSGLYHEAACKTAVDRSL